LLCFAMVSIENNYTKPIFEEGTALKIKTLKKYVCKFEIKRFQC